MRASYLVPIILTLALFASCGSESAGVPQPDGSTGFDGSTEDASVVDGQIVVEVDGGVLVVNPRDPVIPIAPQDPLALSNPDEPLGPTPPSDALLFRKTDYNEEFCLAVDGQPRAGATVTATACTPQSMGWRSTGGALMPAADETLCVDTNIYASEQPSLVPCDARRTDLKLEGHFLIVTTDGGERRTITPFVNEDSTELVAWNMLPDHANWFFFSEIVEEEAQRIKDLESELAQRIAELENELGEGTPTYPHPATQVASVDAALAQHELGELPPPYPGVEVHPSALAGVIDEDTPAHSVRVFFDRAHEDPINTRAYWSTPPDWQSTGVYAPPGAALAVVVPNDADGGLEAIINVHMDTLKVDDANIAAEGEFRRPPQVSSRFELKPGVNFIRSAFGGSVVLASAEPFEKVVPIDIHGGVEQARFVRGVTTSAQWQRRRSLSAPWAIIEGDHSVIVVPRTQIENLESPEQVAGRYDLTVELEREVAGFDDSAPAHRTPSGKFWIVTDRQISLGYGHSGNPVMVLEPWNLARQDDFGEGWGVWHELGHNHQQYEHWSARFGVEVTCNIFSLYAQQTFGGGHPLKAQTANMLVALDKGPVAFDSLSDLFEQLVFLAQVAWAFPEKGFLLFQGVNRATRELDAEQAAAIASSPQGQLDHLYLHLSRAAQHDLVGHFERWGLPPSEDARSQINAEALPVPTEPVWRTAAPATEG